uniref:Uncharacterized protein n=1 Tax=Rhizophagus irregularis (strain DAOM 181602 / DAOM 197198 / MUCL 43194) TaxID=747089 RepID=U9UKA1_RHIID
MMRAARTRAKRDRIGASGRYCPSGTVLSSKRGEAIVKKELIINEEKKEKELEEDKILSDKNLNQAGMRPFFQQFPNIKDQTMVKEIFHRAMRVALIQKG